MINKAMAAGITLVFMALVRPDEKPSIVAASFVALMVYEAALFCINYCQKMNRKKKAEHYILAGKIDMRRWERQRFTA